MKTNFATPWKAAPRQESKDYVIRDAQGAWVATTGDRKHAERIADCVNACARIGTKAVKEIAEMEEASAALMKARQ